MIPLHHKFDNTSLFQYRLYNYYKTLQIYDVDKISMFDFSGQTNTE